MKPVITAILMVAVATGAAATDEDKYPPEHFEVYAKAITVNDLNVVRPSILALRNYGEKGFAVLCDYLEENGDQEPASYAATVAGGLTKAVNYGARLKAVLDRVDALPVPDSTSVAGRIQRVKQILVCALARTDAKAYGKRAVNELTARLKGSRRVASTDSIFNDIATVADAIGDRKVMYPLVPYLINFAGDSFSRIRESAVASLNAVSGQNFQVPPGHDQARKQQMLEHMREWYYTNKGE